MCVNDVDNATYLTKANNLKPQGYHWSLRVLDRQEKSFYHYESISDLNHSYATQITQNVQKAYRLIEKPTTQQYDGVSCGLHVLVNAKSVLDSFLNLSNTSNSKQKKNVKQSDKNLSIQYC